MTGADLPFRSNEATYNKSVEWSDQQPVPAEEHGGDKEPPLVRVWSFCLGKLLVLSFSLIRVHENLDT